jgi:hypothetical protein
MQIIVRDDVECHLDVLDVTRKIEQPTETRPPDDPYLWLEERERRVGKTAGPMAADVV